jgi:hypothetical protein
MVMFAVEINYLFLEQTCAWCVMSGVKEGAAKQERTVEVLWRLVEPAGW